MPVYLPARTPSTQQDSDPLYVLARRAGLIPGASEDQTDRLQWWLTQLVAQTRPVGKLPPGRYNASDQLTIDNSNGAKPIGVLGDGGQFGAAGAQCVIYWANDTDPGDGKYAIQVSSSGGAPVVFGGIALVGSQDGRQIGRPQWECRGLHVTGRMRVYDTGATGFHSGISIEGDHHHIHDCTFQGNTYNIEIPPNGQSQGDVRISKVQAGNASIAGIGVAKSSKLGGWRLEDVELSQTAYCILRYDDGTEDTVDQNWITGLIADGIATEYTGHGLVCNLLEDGCGITNVYWDHGNENWGLFGANTWEVADPPPQLAAWYNDGPISNVTFGGSFPTSVDGRPSVWGGALDGVSRIGRGAGIPGALAAGHRFWKADGGVLIDCFNGRRDGHGSCQVIGLRLTGTESIARGEVITEENELGAKKYAGTGEAIGIAGHAADQNDEVHAIVASKGDSNCLVKNTSGVTIDAYSDLQPHASGGVAVRTDGQKIGRSLVSIADGATGAANIRI